jgi:hypothetical protein
MACWTNRESERHDTNLQGHQQTLALNVRETEVDATGIPIYITIPYNVVDLGIDAVEESVTKGDNTVVVRLNV